MQATLIPATQWITEDMKEEVDEGIPKDRE